LQTYRKATNQSGNWLPECSPFRQLPDGSPSPPDSASCAFAFMRFVGCMSRGIEILKPEARKEFIDEVAMRIGQIGIVARSVLFAIIGVSLVSSGISFDPNEVRCISGALTELGPAALW